jgi:RNA polymerase sigma-70 factor (ECF subfamily)
MDDQPELLADVPEPETVADIPPGELARLIAELPVGYRTVFNLYVIDGLSHREIAQQLGINEKSSASQLVHARRQLSAKIEAWRKENL